MVDMVVVSVGTTKVNAWQYHRITCKTGARHVHTPAAPKHNRSRSGGASMSSLCYQEQLRRQKIINLMENEDFLLVMASQQLKSVQQVKYELLQQLTHGYRKVNNIRQ